MRTPPFLPFPIFQYFSIRTVTVTVTVTTDLIDLIETHLEREECVSDKTAGVGSKCCYVMLGSLLVDYLYVGECGFGARRVELSFCGGWSGPSSIIAIQKQRRVLAATSVDLTKMSLLSFG
jgi:hypothetical protein